MASHLMVHLFQKTTVCFFCTLEISESWFLQVLSAIKKCDGLKNILLYGKTYDNGFHAVYGLQERHPCRNGNIDSGRP